MVVGELSQERDVMIIGGGPGGYCAAIRAAQLGLQVSLVERDELGGVCLNKGCIPSKVLTHAAKKSSELPHYNEIGLHVSEATIKMEELASYKTKVVEQLKKGVEALCKANKVEIIKGEASFLSDDRIGVELGHQFDTYTFKQAIIATGSQAVSDYSAYKRVYVSHELFNFDTLPEHLIVYGSEYLALEVAMSYHQLGSQVSLVLDKELPLDEAVSKEVKRLLKKQKIRVHKGLSLQEVLENDQEVAARFVTSDNEEVTVEGSHLFVEGDRKPNIDKLGVERLGVELTQDGRIRVNETMQTSLPSIYAIGDVTEGPMLAVKAIKQGKAAAEVIAGMKPEVDLTMLPTIVHSLPPIAAVGLTEKEAQEQGYQLRVGSFPLGGNGYGAILGETGGFIKVISDANTDLLLGVHMIGFGAIELSSSFVQALEMVAKEEDIKFPLYAHPSMNEGFLEAVESLVGQAIHLAPPKQKVKQ